MALVQREEKKEQHQSQVGQKQLPNTVAEESGIPGNPLPGNPEENLVPESRQLRVGIKTFHTDTLQR